MITEEDIFRQEMSSPPYEAYHEDLVGEYLWLDSKAGKIYRYMQDDSFGELPDDDQGELLEKYMLIKQLMEVVWYRAERKGLTDEIRNLLQ